jgi:hypothetical protein
MTPEEEKKEEVKAEGDSVSVEKARVEQLRTEQ